MIIWINGAYGAGKSTIAEELQTQMANSYLYDPENAGNFIRDNLPGALWLDDFQEYPVWRSIQAGMLLELDKRHDGNVIVPMTIVNQTFYREICDTLLSHGVVIKMFLLCASADVLHERLIRRGERADSWCVAQINRCVHALETFPGIPIGTNHKDPDDIVQEILRNING